MILIIALLCSLTNTSKCHQMPIAAADSIETCKAVGPQITEWARDNVPEDQKLVAWRCAAQKQGTEI